LSIFSVVRKHVLEGNIGSSRAGKPMSSISGGGHTISRKSKLDPLWVGRRAQGSGAG
jgi:hypothetical protein